MSRLTIDPPAFRPEKFRYEKSGVSQVLGDSVSEIMANACRMTYENPTLGSVYSDGTDALYRPLI